MFINQKEVAGEIQLVVMIEKNIIGIDSEKAKERVPKTVVFLILLHGYPEIPPKVLTKAIFAPQHLWMDVIY